MDKYRSLVAWQRAHASALLTLRLATVKADPAAREVFWQLRRAAVSVEANIVEGYALGSTAQFKRHLRIAMGSAAEAECLVRTAMELGWIPEADARTLEGLLERTMAAILGLLRKRLTPPAAAIA